MQGKVVVGVLIAVILAAVVFIVHRTVGGGPPPVPKQVSELQMTMIEVKAPYKSVIRSLGEWEKLGRDAAGKYKDPDTREYTMVSPMTCAACGQQIPALQYPADIASLPGDKLMAETQKLKSEYKCPKCQGSPFPVEKE